MSMHTLYRFFDREGALLYVGRTIAPDRRWREHERRADWFGAVASVTREVLPSAEALDQAERAAIFGEAPLHNVRHNRRPVSTPIDDLGDRMLYSVDHAAARLQEDPRVVARLISEGELDSVKIGRRRLVPHEAIEDYVARLRRAS